MANEEKFAKTINDETLDEIAGGNRSETAKDIKFLKKLGLDVKDNLQVVAAWSKVGIENTYYAEDKYKNKYELINEKGRRVKISRNDAMIYAMRKQNRYLNLEDFI